MQTRPIGCICKACTRHSPNCHAQPALPTPSLGVYPLIAALSVCRLRMVVSDSVACRLSRLTCRFSSVGEVAGLEWLRSYSHPSLRTARHQPGHPPIRLAPGGHAKATLALVFVGQLPGSSQARQGTRACALRLPSTDRPPWSDAKLKDCDGCTSDEPSLPPPRYRRRASTRWLLQDTACATLSPSRPCDICAICPIWRGHYLFISFAVSISRLWLAYPAGWSQPTKHWPIKCRPGSLNAAAARVMVRLWRPDPGRIRISRRWDAAVELFY